MHAHKRIMSTPGTGTPAPLPQVHARALWVWSEGRRRDSYDALMATAPERRSLESSSRPGRSPKTRGSSLRHRTRSQHDVMKESEQSLHKLLEDFEEGRLNAFGKVSKLPKIQILLPFSF